MSVCVSVPANQMNEHAFRDGVSLAGEAAESAARDQLIANCGDEIRGIIIKELKGQVPN